MVFLLLRILFTVAFSHLLRLSQARTRWPMGAAAVNYLVAAVACAGWAAQVGGGWHGRTVLLGGLAGFTYVTSLLLILPSMRRSGVSLTGAVVQLALMLPVGVSIWRFGEYPNHFQWGGIGLTLVALPLLSAASAVASEEGRHGFSPLTLFLFLSTGASQVLMKEFSATCPPSGLALYSAALFASSTLFTCLWIIAARDWPGAARDGRQTADGGRQTMDDGRQTADGERRVGRDLPSSVGRLSSIVHRPSTAVDRRLFSVWGVGLAMGAVNMAQLVFLLLALRALPAVVVFPLSAALGIAVNAGASMLLWGERPPPAGWLGIALAIGAVALLNMR
jgi:drug/metabolite transporter (DMT)-like permease